MGVGVGIVGFGAAMGALFAVAYAICRGRVGNLRPRSLALSVAGFGFLGQCRSSSTRAIRRRSVIRRRSGPQRLVSADGGSSLLLLVLAVVLGTKLKARFGNWNATLISAAAFVAVIGAV